MGSLYEEIADDAFEELDHLAKNGTNSTEKEKHFFDDDNFDDLDKNSFFDHDAPFPVTTYGSCTRVLYSTIWQGSSLRLWDLMILIPTGIFLAFLIFRFGHARQKLRASNSLIFKAFYALVFGSAIVSVARCFVSMTLTSSNQVADKLMWLFVRFILVSTEMSVLVFGLGSGHLDSQSSIRRVVTVSSAISLTFSVTQGVLELAYPDPIFHIHTKTLDTDLFGHGGMIFWMLTSALFTMIYILVLLLPFLPCRHQMSLPNRRSFYQYAGFMMVLYLIQTVSSALVFGGVPAALCFVNLTTFVYFTSFIPIVYFTFLFGFFKVAQPSLLFSYKAQVINNNRII